VQQGVRDTTTWLGIFLELNAIDFKSVLNKRAQTCSEAFWRPRESLSM